MRFRTAQCSQTLVRFLAHESLKTETNGVRIRGGSACAFCFIEELVVNIECFFHTDNYAI